MKIGRWLGLMLALAAPAAAIEIEATSCVTCHRDPDLFDSEQIEHIERYEADVHAAVGLSCHDCHGGNPALEVADDLFAAKDEEFVEHPYVGAPVRSAVPEFCGRCHSDPGYMRRFRPDARVDQVSEYRTSRHGMGLAAGDEAVATCVDCHGSHGVLRPSNPESPVYPTRVAETCRTCHGDGERMAGYELASGSPLPIDQYERWRASVHGQAMHEREDLSAPTCNDCHGNHGALPPEVGSIDFVCGQCHGREAEVFRASAKPHSFESHNVLLADAGDEGCAACHDGFEPLAPALTVRSFAECASCHDHHAVVTPSVALLGALPETPCAFCHEAPPGLADEIDEPVDLVRSYEAMRDALLSQAQSVTAEGRERYDWLVDRALALPNHTFRTSGSDSPAALRPEFERLFEKFRIGKIAHRVQDPATGDEGRFVGRSCTGCHGVDPAMADDSEGAKVAAMLITRMRELTALTARAERVLLRARRGGVETRAAEMSIDQAIDAQIGLQVLVHGFTAAEDSEFMTRYHVGMEHARQGLAEGQAALDELGFRRTGLAISLGLVALALVSLALKIRQLSETA